MTSAKIRLLKNWGPIGGHVFLQENNVFEQEEIFFCINSQLVENVVLLLEVLNVWDENEESVEWTEMAQVGMRILLAFISQPETEFCATASSKLSKLLKARQITSQWELCYILGRLHQAFVASKEKGTKDYGFLRGPGEKTVVIFFSCLDGLKENIKFCHRTPYQRWYLRSPLDP